MINRPKTPSRPKYLPQRVILGQCGGQMIIQGVPSNGVQQTLVKGSVPSFDPIPSSIPGVSKVLFSGFDSGSDSGSSTLTCDFNFTSATLLNSSGTTFSYSSNYIPVNSQVVSLSFSWEYSGSASIGSQSLNFHYEDTTLSYPLPLNERSYTITLDNSLSTSLAYSFYVTLDVQVSNSSPTQFFSEFWFSSPIYAFVSPLPSSVVITSDYSFKGISALDFSKVKFSDFSDLGNPLDISESITKSFNCPTGSHIFLLCPTDYKVSVVSFTSNFNEEFPLLTTFSNVVDSSYSLKHHLYASDFPGLGEVSYKFLLS